MNTARTLLRARQWLTCALVSLAAFAAATPARADEDPPGRVGRLSAMQGSVSWFDAEQGQWDEAERNRPLTTGDRVSTAARARAEVRVGSTVLRLGGGTEIELLRLDDERIHLQLHSGSLAMRVRSRAVAAEIELVTQEARLLPQRAGHYRFDRDDDTTQAGVWRGTLRVDAERGFLVETGQRVELWREGRGDRAELRHDWKNPLQSDDFAEWVLKDDQRDERSASSRYVSPEMTGAEDLDRHGRWEQHPEYGAIWLPLEVRADWAPYREGRWAWVRPWGWTWVDEAPWGFAPFHYGRWVHWRGRWGWTPGNYIARPVYAPALVAWVGGAHWGVSVNFGGPAIGWLPLAPFELFVPHYRSSPNYRDRINLPPHRPGHRPPPQQVPTGPVSYGNQHAPGAVTVVPRDALALRQPVSRSVINPQPGANGPGRPWVAAQPPTREPRGPREPHESRPPVQMVPGGAQPLPAPGHTPPQMGPQRPAPVRVEPSVRPVAPPTAPERPSGRERDRDVQRGNDRSVDRGGDRNVDRNVDRNIERNTERNNAAPDRRPGTPAMTDLRRERVGPAAPAATPTPAPQSAQPAPAPHSPQPTQAAPARPAVQAAPPAPAPQAAPPAAAPPAAAPPQRQRPAEPDKRQEREDDRKGRPEARPQVRERENQR
jgi:hypothetical protein